MPVQISFFVATLALGLVAGPARGEAPPCLPAKGQPVEVTQVAGDATLLLSDGRMVRLAALAVPHRLGREAIAADRPRLQAAARFLEETAVGHRFLLLGAAKPDRRGRIAGHLVDDGDKSWLNGAFAAAGHGWVMPMAGDTPCAAALLEQEASARKDRIGLWQDETFQPLAADDTELPSKGDTYALVEGEIISTGRAGRRRYIDFGRDHRTDFTVVIDDRDWARFTAAGIVLDRLKGRHVRVRGWLTAHQGSEMMLDVPEEMEWLD
jgi:endonuclease YncB( thermonuclease family)